ncbi:23S rRNA (uracil(1939)-C(5))-methyltransferase RlmD [Chryseobacterium mucoviscidosis]|uniref:23S rRNA (uracil(1939)-C(5))-methyltransferase RlmD n=1 Tax=unclassified Paenibacillus TaxID=185978 RepID=UPI0009A455A8|nr:23S rRNA (uracil(1939)-C(5))-methyltransferase RlmD [Paenibacillus sp. 11B]MDN8591786.1 23S rRNA (uracil(1939)-C(5))-methyltransferase RlmD [Paenibacillus sp. 11B]OPG94768.1 23S rRNA (uracil(1939)-C(5))-methyltransferase RlmD [Chryseobacterium mucoviscidosis]
MSNTNRSGRGKNRRNSAASQGQGNASASRQSSKSSRPSTRQQGKEVRPQGASLSAVRPKGRERESAPIEGLPVSKNEETVIDIIGMNHDGEGVGRANGYTLFVQGALPGETVRVRVMKTKKQYGYAKLLEIVKASPDRVSAPCPIYDQCGGCQIQHMSYTGQLAWKRQLVVDNLQRIGKLNVLVEDEEQAIQPEQTSAEEQMNGSNRIRLRMEGVMNEEDAEHAIRVLPTMGMDEPWRYRNKAQVPIGAAEGGLVGGFYAKGSHRIIDMDTCLIQHEHNDEVVAKVKELGSHLGISAYNEETGRGLLRHVVVKKAFRTGEMMLVLVTNGRDIPYKDEWIGSIREAIPHVASICQNVNKKQTNVIFGDETRVLWGRDVIYDYIGDVQFAISARSFYQVNPVQTEVLYGKTVEYAGLSGKETVIDAYCGIGTISLFLAQHADQVYGVEIVPEAIEDARSNALLNEMKNVKFEVGASEDVIPRWKEQGIEADVIVVDPPRKGCDPRLLDTILEMKPERVVYVSCNPSTLARDLRVLEDGGYRTVEVTPVDMFPHTNHVEAVCSLIYKGF